MSKQSKAPASAAHAQDDDLPMTGVKERRSVQTILDLQSKLEEYSKDDVPVAPTPEPQPNDDTTMDAWQKRYGDLRRYTQKKEQETTNKIKELESQIQQLQSASNQTMPKSKEEFLAWKEKYPDIATFIEMIADEKSSERSKQLAEELETVKGQLGQTEKEKAKATLKSLVPDVDAITSSKVFLDWYKNQPPFVQEKLSSSDDPYEVAYYLNIFKSLSGAPQDKSEKVKTPKEIPAALNVGLKNSGSGPADNSAKYKFTESQIAKMSGKEFERLEKEIDEADRQGLILKDISRKQWHTDV